MNRLPGSPRLRASAGNFPLRWLWITDGGRLERDGEAQLGYLRLNWSRVEESNFLLGGPRPPFLPIEERTGFEKWTILELNQYMPGFTRLLYR